MVDDSWDRDAAFALSEKDGKKGRKMTFVIHHCDSAQAVRAVAAVDFASTTLIFEESVIAPVPVSAETVVLEVLSSSSSVLAVLVAAVVLLSSLAQPRKTKLIITIIGRK